MMFSPFCLPKHWRLYFCLLPLGWGGLSAAAVADEREAVISHSPQPVCPAGAGQKLPRNVDDLQVLARQLAEREPDCQEQAAFLAWYGAVLNALGQAEAASTRLERALMLEPELLAARVEYAVALGRSSRWGEAVDLADQLLADPSTPQRLRVPLRNYRDYWATRLPGFWGAAQVQLGYSTNLNTAPSRSSHFLTFGGQEFPFDLSESEQPRAGSAVMVELVGGHESQFGNGDQLYATTVLRMRHSEQYNETDYLQADGALNWTGEVNSARFNRLLGASVQILQGGASMAALRGGANYEYSVRNCTLRGGLDLEWRAYPDERTLDGVVPGLIFGGRCDLPGFRMLQPGLHLRLERDYATHPERPGGDQRRLELIAGLRHPLAAGWLETILSRQWLFDQHGYSPLLENNNLRRLDKTQLKLEYKYPIEAGWLAVTGYNWARQDSNLSLFRNQEQSAWLGFRRQW
ncbi:MAG: hypothetical protein RL210_2015 [Pseudomonadota bacterium]|jgi:hypothetical protein